MRTLLFSLFIVLSIAQSSRAGGCDAMKEAFEREEAAYDTVAKVAVAGNSSHAIIGRFAQKGEMLLRVCPKVYSLDRQYTLKRKLKKAKMNQNAYWVFSQAQVAEYARTHPEEIIVYKWGKIRPVP